MNRLTDWLAWLLHGVLGAGLGAVLGFALISRRYHGFWLHGDLVPWFITGAVLIGAGAGTWLGDRLWLGEHYRLYPPDAPAGTWLNKLLSVLMVLAGAGLAGLSVVAHFAGR